jgi:accessory gene regulator protein AgrB
MTLQSEFNAPFYETVATVIPVLMIVLFFESGYFRPRPRENVEFAAIAAIAMLTLVAAEANVLSALYRGQNLDGMNWHLVQVALIYSLGAIAILPLFERVSLLVRTGRWNRRGYERALLLLLLFILVALIAALLAGVDLIDVITVAGFLSFTILLPLFVGLRLLWRTHQDDSPRNDEVA